MERTPSPGVEATPNVGQVYVHGLRQIRARYSGVSVPLGQPPAQREGSGTDL